MYCVMRASVPSLYNVYRRYDIAGYILQDHYSEPCKYSISESATLAICLFHIIAPDFMHSHNMPFGKENHDCAFLA